MAADTQVRKGQPEDRKEKTNWQVKKYHSFTNKE